MLRRVELWGALCAIAAALPAMGQATGPAAWQNDLTPISAKDWNYDFAAHLLERAGFGGTPEEIQALAKMTPAAGDRATGALRRNRRQRPAPFR